MLAQLNGHCIDRKIFFPTTIKSHVVKIFITWSISPPKTITLDWSIDIYVSITRSKSYDLSPIHVLCLGSLHSNSDLYKSD